MQDFIANDIKSIDSMFLFNVLKGLVYFFNAISTPYSLFNAKIWLICQYLIIIITLYQHINFTKLHGFKYSYLILIVYAQLYGLT